MLDVGSGTGSLAHEIAARKTHARVLGIDPSQEYVAYAVSKNAFPERVGFEVGDARQLHFPDASCDAALALLVFNFIPDPKKALLELRRIVKPGGRISAAVWDYGAGMRMLDEKHMPLCRSGELPALWRQGGLEYVSEQSIDISMSFGSFADYWDPFLLRQGPAGAYVARLDRDRLQALRNEVKRRLSLPAENTRFVLPARVWAVRGTVPNRRQP
ncbi:MAG: class I SAM-dependent methyltransferase [Acidobacteriia bacterium]|nr:class I SAM-dependent methyltransferase [Terriglobia bacterium]